MPWTKNQSLSLWLFAWATSSFATTVHHTASNDIFAATASVDVDPFGSAEQNLEHFDRDLVVVTDNCMEDVYDGGSTLGCTAKDIKFQQVTGFVVYDSMAEPPDENGIVYGACRGNDDYVNVSFTVNFETGPNKYDLAMFVATDGGDALFGQCDVSVLKEGTWGTVVVTEVDAGTDADHCPDIVNSGTLVDYPFSPMLLKCADAASLVNGATVLGESDGLLDFDIGIAWGGSKDYCDPNDPANLPKPRTSSKCWYDATSRVTLKIHVPPNPTPTSQPSDVPSDPPSVSPSVSNVPSRSPSQSPSISTEPSKQPSQSPSISTEPTSKPSQSPSISSMPSDNPTRTPSKMPSDAPSLNPTLAPSDSPTDMPSLNPTLTPSDVPSLNPTSAPSDSPSKMPSTSPSDAPSLDPTSAPSDAPSKTPSSLPTSAPSRSPSSEPTLKPSLAPSISSQPSKSPSESPSISSAPSDMPSDVPSVEPTSLPSQSPSISTEPSVAPTDKPSISAHPSSATEYPSISPSISSEPSLSPSQSPSISAEPSAYPTSVPSVSSEPSSSPSMSPSISSMPTDVPSLSPSVSAAPSFSTDVPSSSPSISAEPTAAPSGTPSISSMPSSSPSAAPSAEPSAQPTDGYYYPDWTNEDQVCTNDGHDPEYMLEIQRVNYLYRSKEDCCRNHFWWRITQCMANEHPMYYSTGSSCDVKVVFEDWESKYTPGSWDASGLYETLEDCCISEFWYDIEGCMGVSPRDTAFAFSFDVHQLLEPGNCQDADIIANAIGVGINDVLGGTSYAEVQEIGCATLSRNYDTGNPECGGCLAGATFLGNYDGRGVDLTGAELATTTVRGIITTTSASCTDAACFEELLDSVITKFSASIADGSLTDAIVAWSYAREPPVLQLQATSIVTTSFEHETGTNPYTVTADSSSGLEVTTGGSFDVNFDFSLITTVEELNLFASYFQNAIAAALETGGDLPSGAVIDISSICGIDLATASNPVECLSGDTAIEYSSMMYLAHDADAVGVAALLSDVLSNPSTVQSITSAVIADASTGVSVPLTEVTTSGSLTVTNFDPSSFTTEETSEVMTIFQQAILESLVDQDLVPPGSSVVVTSVSNGVVEYDIITHVDASVDSSAMIFDIGTSLDNSATMTAISTSVSAASSESSSTTLSTATQFLAVSSSTLGASTISDVFKVTTSGEFSVPTLDGASLTTAQDIDEASGYFEDAIIEQLKASGLLPTGSTVTVTSILNGVVKYEIALYSSSTSMAETTVNQISDLFSGTSSATTLDAISTSVESASSSSSSEAISSTLSSVSISSYNKGDTTGISLDGTTASSLTTALQSMSIDSFTASEVKTTSLAKYYPDWVVSKTCVNDGRSPPSFSDIGNGYLFDTAEECCLMWFSFDKTCGKTSSELSALKFYPDFSGGECGRKPLNELESTLYTYDSLAECCLERFPLTLDECCDADGLGGCVGSGVDKYVPDYINQKCYAKNSDFISGWEVKLSSDSIDICCKAAFPWNPNNCCANSGGC